MTAAKQTATWLLRVSIATALLSAVGLLAEPGRARVDTVQTASSH
jgi:hypothetical protein